MAEPWLEDGLGLTGGARWRKKRTFFNPSFHTRMLKNFVGTINESTLKVTRQFSDQVTQDVSGCPTINVSMYAHKLVLDILLKCMMGVSSDDVLAKRAKYVDHCRRATAIMGPLAFSASGSIPYLKYLQPCYWEMLYVIKQMHNFTESVIKDRKLKRKLANNNKDTSQCLEDINEELTFLGKINRSHLMGIFNTYIVGN